MSAAIVDESDPVPKAPPHEIHHVAGDPAREAVHRQLRDKLVEMIVMQGCPRTRRELFALGVH